MAKTAIGDLHARLTADVTQYDAEMKRAAAATQRTAQSINGELDGLQKNIARKFTLGDIGKDLLKGLGLGSGFAVAQTAVELMANRLREQAELEESITAELQKQHDIRKQIIMLGRSPAEQRQILEKEMAGLVSARGKITDPVRRTFTPTQLPPGWALMSEEEKRMKMLPFIVDLTDKEREAVAKLDTAIDALTLKIKGLTQEETKNADQAAKNDYTRRIAALTSGLRKQEEAFNDMVDAARKRNDEAERTRKENEAEVKRLDAIAEKYRQLADPMREYLQRIKEIDDAEANSRLTMDQAAKARAIIIDESPAGKAFALSQQRFAQVPALEEDTKVLAMAAQDMGFAFSSAFENAVIAGEKLSDVMRSLGQDILRVFLRLAVTNPLINSIFGGVSGFQALPTLFGGPRADGGPVNSGSTYLVGENGPELFQPRQSGMIVPNHALGGGGVTVNLTTNFANGVTRQEVAAMLPKMVEAAKSAVADAVGRGGGYRRAFA